LDTVLDQYRIRIGNYNTNPDPELSYQKECRPGSNLNERTINPGKKRGNLEAVTVTPSCTHVGSAHKTIPWNSGTWIDSSLGGPYFRHRGESRLHGFKSRDFLVFFMYVLSVRTCYANYVSCIFANRELTVRNSWVVWMKGVPLQKIMYCSVRLA